MTEFIHEYSELGEIPTTCHIRILNEEDKPLVIMCTQITENKGRSITNIAEFIAIDIKNHFEHKNLKLSTAIKRYLREKKLSEMLGDLIDGLRKKDGYSVLILESIKLALEYSERYRTKKEKYDRFVWVEHYPKGVLSIIRSDRYSIVTFDDTWRPSWEHCDIESVSEYTGYPTDMFKSPKLVS